MKFSAVSLFSGCGGSDLGLKAAGVEAIWSNDIDAFACESYPHVVGKKDVIHHGDIAGFDKFPKADILVGCYPCQGYSQGGRRVADSGINYLYREFDRVLRKVKPIAFIVENVDGMRFSHNQALFTNQITRFRMAGYKVTWSAVDARSYGLAQQRKRLFIVGVRSSEAITYEFPKPTHGINGVPFKSLKDVIWNYKDAPVGSYNTEAFHWYYLSRNRRREWDDQSPTIVAHWRHIGLHPDSPPLEKVRTDEWRFSHEGKARRFSYIECALLQGFPNPDAFARGKVESRFRVIGNAVPPPLFEAVSKALVDQLTNR